MLGPRAFQKKMLSDSSWLTEESSLGSDMESYSRVDIEQINKRYPGMSGSLAERSGSDLLTQTGSLPKTRSFGGSEVFNENDFQKRLPSASSFGGASVGDLSIPGSDRYQS